MESVLGAQGQDSGQGQGRMPGVGSGSLEAGQSQCRMPGVGSGSPESGQSQARVRPESVPNAWSRLWMPGVIAACHASLLDTQSQRCIRGVSARCPESVLVARSRFWMPRVGPESVLNTWSQFWTSISSQNYMPRVTSLLNAQSQGCM